MARRQQHQYVRMGLKDDIFYTTVEVRLESYPRIDHFQTELLELFPRFLGLYEELPESLQLTVDMLKSLKDAVHPLTNVSTVLFLFGLTHLKIPKVDLIKKSKVTKHGTHPLEEMNSVDEKNLKLGVAICTLRMMDTKKGRDTLLKVRDRFGVQNMIVFVDEEYEFNNDLVVNNLASLETLLRLKKENMNVVYQSKHDISNVISNHMEHKFVSVFKSLNMFLLEITKKRTRTHGPTFGAKGTGGRFYKEIKGFFDNPVTVLDILLTSNGRSVEEKLATAIICFLKTLLTREIARTYEMQDAKVFDYLQKENYEKIWIELLENHLSTVTLVTKFQKVIQNPNNELTKWDVQKQYTSDDAKTIGKDVTKVLMGHFLEVGVSVKNIRVKLDSLTLLRKELMRLMEETISGEKYEDDIPKLEKWGKQLERIKEIESFSHVFGKLCVFLKMPESTDREKEVRTQIGKYLTDYPGEFVVEVVSHKSFSGRHTPGNNSKIAMGDAFLSKSGNRGTIGLFMYEDGNESKGLHFVTSSHIVLGSDEVISNDARPVRLGKTRHSLTTEDGLVDIAAIRIERNVQNRCNVFFQENNETCESMILDMDGIRNLKEGKHVYKRGSETGETKGCIISQDYKNVGLSDHHFLVGLLVEKNEPALHRAFAREGDSGAVLYTKTPDGEVQYIAVLMGEFKLRQTEDQPYLIFKDLIKRIGSPILTTCLREGLNRIDERFGVRLTLPKI